MEIKKILKNTSNFFIKRFIEVFGFFISILSILLLLSLLSYSPEDPNFIFPGNTEIKNILGFKGSFISDLFFQSIGLISILIPITLFITGINIMRTKKILLILKNSFYLILYTIIGSLFFTVYYPESFWLTINGNGGFVGKLLSETFLIPIINLNKQIFYYLFVIIIFIIFLISINFNIYWFFNLIKKIIFKLFSKNENILTSDKNIDNEIKNLSPIFNKPVQEDLPFTSSENAAKVKFKLPSIDFLKFPTKAERKNNLSEDNIDKDFLEKILLDFGVEGKIKKISHGPVVSLNEFEPAPGIKVSKVINLAEDIARNTSSESARIDTIPGKNTVGIELPKSTRENVYLSEIISDINFKNRDIKLPIALGKDISGSPVTGDLSSMPHLLIAGTTGSGKSICINTIILSLLYKHTPEKCKFILIDPKMLELSTYEAIPHLLCPVITEAKKAASVLGWVVKEMESRYRLMTKEGVRNIDGYNNKHKLPMPYIVVIVDEMSDLMLVAGKEIENYVQKLSQMARAAGIHIIMATQRPSVDVITGTIKANFPTRISFQVSSKIDSRTVIGEQGAEQLLGKGDMLYMSSANKIVRIHAPYVSENEIEKINNFLRSQSEPDYVDEILNFADEKEIGENFLTSENKDELYEKALEIIKSEGKASTSFLQRKLQIGYNRAARIIDMMETEGIISKANHVGKRDIL
ncbi:MAG TPA: DNA translocase FtsK 4TM domain-containing protein [Candidatus Pelagibacter bacterium]|jgi:S-DNA-T family DNA segregation ATPase FtsK/SpoIIIE|nr:DNA translocase FtsK 4TM domain-containing protein [Candidatus Pelagibacter bacterium]|tara:strand:- start:3537 stop:5621 length:2085 start_codon:yes stop_codon:yes gene_type:complete